MTTPYGYFKWTQQNGKPFPSKYIAEGDSILNDSKAYYEDAEIKKWPLMTEAEFKHSLDTLVARYPLPDDWQQVYEKAKEQRHAARAK